MYICCFGTTLTKKKKHTHPLRFIVALLECSVGKKCHCRDSIQCNNTMVVYSRVTICNVTHTQHSRRRKTSQWNLQSAENTYEDNSTRLEMFQLGARDNDELNILFAKDMPNRNSTQLAQNSQVAPQSHRLHHIAHTIE